MRLRGLQQSVADHGAEVLSGAGPLGGHKDPEEALGKALPRAGKATTGFQVLGLLLRRRITLDVCLAPLFWAARAAWVAVAEVCAAPSSSWEPDSGIWNGCTATSSGRAPPRMCWSRFFFAFVSLTRLPWGPPRPSFVLVLVYLSSLSPLDGRLMQRIDLTLAGRRTRSLSNSCIVRMLREQAGRVVFLTPSSIPLSFSKDKTPKYSLPPPLVPCSVNYRDFVFSLVVCDLEFMLLWCHCAASLLIGPSDASVRFGTRASHVCLPRLRSPTTRMRTSART
ncbi:hypothetical protein DFH08DRAFT_978106 [Mycena albidolilacea]|uniref:Uncharacterized protein n=1 Tax=Mycena albidolilacea TaxID=1033008 RepID=A0AAD6YZH4_9AGAR|nr:hypothetical protein DFH08DRAFT_978106 [Mycena albidolilacea]